MIQPARLRKFAAIGIALMGVSPAFGQLSDTTTGPGYGQSSTLKDLLAGTTYPLSLKLKDLNGDWRRFSARGQSAISTMMELMAGSPSTGNVYYTRGQTVMVGGETFLVAYSTPEKPQDLSRMIGGYRDRTPPPPLTPDSPLSLTLLNLRTSGSLTDIRAFDLTREIKDSEPPPPDPVEQNRQSENNLKQLGLAVITYEQDYDEKFPPMETPATMKKAVYPDVKSEQVFLNPRTKKPYGVNASLSKKSIAVITEPANMVILYEEVPTPEGTRAVCFADGHVKRIQETDWPKLKAASGIR